MHLTPRMDCLSGRELRTDVSRCWTSAVPGTIDALHEPVIGRARDCDAILLRFPAAGEDAVARRSTDHGKAPRVGTENDTGVDVLCGKGGITDRTADELRWNVPIVKYGLASRAGQRAADESESGRVRPWHDVSDIDDVTASSDHAVDERDA